mgnify:FL=1
MHIKLTNGIPEMYSIGQLRRDNPQTSFPKRPGDELLAEWGVYPCVQQDQPDYDRLTEKVSEGPIEQIDGVWTWTWRVEDKPLTLDQAQFVLAEWINQLTYQVEWKYPRVIQKGWDEEEEMALAYKAETETPEQLAILTDLASRKNRTVDEHVDRVLYLAGSFHMIRRVVHELWLATDGALEAAQSASEYPDILRSAKQQAAPMAEQHGLNV